MILSVAVIALFGVQNVGGLSEVWNRAVDGNRIFPPEYVKMVLRMFSHFELFNSQHIIAQKYIHFSRFFLSSSVELTIC